jgi:hypothetical protein
MTPVAGIAADTVRVIAAAAVFVVVADVVAVAAVNCRRCR